MIKQTAITLGLMMATGTAFAGEGHAEASMGVESDVPLTQSFAELDADSDGQINWSEAEANGMAKTAFQSAETTEDGSLSMAEFQAAVEARADGVVGEAAEKGELHVVESDDMTNDSMEMNDSMDHSDSTMDHGDMDSMADDAMDTTDGAAEEAGSTVEDLGGDAFGTTEAKPQGDVEADAEAGVE